MIGLKPATGLALIALTITGMASAGAEERMRAGLWEIRSGEGTKTGRIGNTCYTPAMVEVANMPDKTMREATEKTFAKRGCTLKDFKMEGHKIMMANVCPTSSAVVSSTYDGDTFETVDTQTMGGATKVYRIKGRRIGDCK